MSIKAPAKDFSNEEMSQILDTVLETALSADTSERNPNQML